MDDRIEPALTAAKWAEVRAPRSEAEQRLGWAEAEVQHDTTSRAGLVALANHFLPDSDRRKIRREWLSDLRIAQNEAQDAAWRSCMNGEPGKPCDECQRAVDGFKARLQHIADALESYLPPEP